MASVERERTTQELFDSSVRGKNIKESVISHDVLHDAIQKRNTLTSYVKHVAGSTSQLHFIKSFPITLKDVTPSFGITSQTASNFIFEKRALTTIGRYHYAVWDSTDLLDNSLDINMVLSKLRADAVARDNSRAILQSHLNDFLTTAEGTVNADSNQIFDERTVSTRGKHNLFIHDKATETTGVINTSAQTSYKRTFSPVETLTELKYVFQRREVTAEDNEMPCITLTPELVRILANDTNFKNREFTGKTSKMVYDSLSGMSDFVWMGWRFVPILPSAMPTAADVDHLLGEGATTPNDMSDLDAPFRIIGEGLTPLTDPVYIANTVTSRTAANLNNTAANAWYRRVFDGTGTNTAVPANTFSTGTYRSKDLVYCWYPSQTIFYRVPSHSMKVYRANLIEKLAAHANLMIFRRGTLLRDEDYALQTVLFAKYHA